MGKHRDHPTYAKLWGLDHLEEQLFDDALKLTEFRWKKAWTPKKKIWDNGMYGWKKNKK